MKRIKNILAITAFSLLVLGLPAIASAQYRDRDDDYNRGGYGNGGYGNGGYGNGGYGNNTYYGNIRSTVQNLKIRAKNFERMADRIDDRGYGGYGGYGGNGNNDRIEDLADNFQKATERLADAYGRGRKLDNSSDEARRVLDIGSQIERSMYRGGNNSALRNQWNEISNDLRIIANTYGYNYNTRNNRNNRNTRTYGNWRDKLPIRLPF
ncbi:MAG: hypothetical protein KA746_08595 [Pyrinomonadaceae bacterium]|nr:hypothetical protein [Pyrinomonadaceae bacterium]MBP6214054.1 hypothetical protein [Pyrinomonadaceae bacterium]